MPWEPSTGGQPRRCDLLLGQLLHRLEPVPERGRGLEVQFVAGARHLGPEPLGDGSDPTIHEGGNVVEEVGVRTGLDQARTGTGAYSEVVVEADPASPEYGVGAAAEWEYGAYLSHRSPQGLGVGVGTEVAIPLPAQPPAETGSRECGQFLGDLLGD
jgi:hypothetical protein